MRKIYLLALLLAFGALSLWSGSSDSSSTETSDNEIAYPQEPKYLFVIADNSKTVNFAEAIKTIKLLSGADDYSIETFPFPDQLNWVVQEFATFDITGIYTSRSQKRSSPPKEGLSAEAKVKSKKRSFRDIKENSAARQPFTVKISKSLFKNGNEEFFTTLAFPKEFKRPAMIVLLRSNDVLRSVQYGDRKYAWNKANWQYNFDMFIEGTNPADFKLSVAQVAIVDLAN